MAWPRDYAGCIRDFGQKLVYGDLAGGENGAKGGQHDEPMNEHRRRHYGWESERAGEISVEQLSGKMPRKVQYQKENPV